jgi:hypothetical protein
MTEYFIERAKKIHNDKYNYSCVDYQNIKTNVSIICKIHGPFLQKPHNHLAGKGCRICGNNNIKKKLTKNTEKFVKDATIIHGQKYDYSKSNYINNLEEVIIICPEHGEFLQKPKVHKKGHGCQKCGKNDKLDTNEFIERAKKIHKNTFDYSNVNYINNSTNVSINCKIHGQFLQRPDVHLRGSGCKMCKNELLSNLRKKSNEEFIEEAKLIHGENTYNYSFVQYIGDYYDVTIICSEHGEFLQKPRNHLRGHGCNKCSSNYTLTQDEFIETAKQIHIDENKNPLYDYSLVNYEKNRGEVTIICSEHGEFNQLAYIHLKGHQCNKCAIKKRAITQINNNQFIEKSKQIHIDENKNPLYDYSLVDYKGSSLEVIIICPIHGQFKKTPDNHIHKTRPQGCQKCQIIKQYSRNSIEWLKLCEIIYNIKIQHAENDGEYKIPNTKYRADGYCDENNTIFEFHGDYFHGNPKNPKSCNPDEINKKNGKTFGELYKTTIEKENRIEKLGYNLVVMWEYDWNLKLKILNELEQKFKCET